MTLDEAMANLAQAADNLLSDRNTSETDFQGVLMVDVDAWNQLHDAMNALNDLAPDTDETLEVEDAPWDIDDFNALPASQSVRVLTPREFILGGAAVFTLTDTQTDEHFTYRINKWMPPNKSDKPRWYANLGTTYQDSVKFTQLLGVEENTDLTCGFWHVGPAAPSRVLFTRFLQCLNYGHALEGQNILFQHAGRCCVCGRELTNPESIASGIGPECAGKMGI